ncbi:MAG: alpha/beta hydrolase [Ilumatobacteraceae bacterium]|nr:alpha/beta hydrolase [Ilumatobacteraceae bacterium]
MTAGAVTDRRSVDLPTSTMTVDRTGAGEPIIVVHGEDGTLFTDPMVEALGQHRTVHLVHLPGWGVSPGSDHVEGVDDLALLVSEYASAEFDDRVPVIGFSFGGWVVAQAAVLDLHSFSHVALVAPVGVKTTGRQDRSYVDLWATDADELRSRLYGAPERIPDLRNLDDDQFLRLAHAGEAVARHAWQPYLFDPKLARRLARLTAPVLIVTGDRDRFVLEPNFGDRWAELVGGSSQHVVLDGVGHRIEEEAPADLARVVNEFLEAEHR